MNVEQRLAGEIGRLVVQIHQAMEKIEILTAENKALADKLASKEKKSTPKV